MLRIHVLVVLLVFLCAAFFFDGTLAGYIGRVCGREWYPNFGAIDSKRVNIHWCIDHCTNYSKDHPEENILYAATKEGEWCICADTYNISAVTHCAPGDAECNKKCSKEGDVDGMPCKGDPSMICGGADWWQVYDAGVANPNTNVISDPGTKVSRACGKGQDCQWNCSIPTSAWPVGKDRVVGSESYDLSSSFCLAAAHAGAYIIGTEAQVKGLRYGMQAPKTVEGSWRNGIQSDWKDDVSEAINFAGAQAYPFIKSMVTSMTTAADGNSTCYIDDTEEAVALMLFDLDGNPMNGTNASAWDSVSFMAEPDRVFYCGLETATEERDPRTFVPVLSSFGHDMQEKVSVTGTFREDIKIAFTGSGRIEKAGRTVEADSDSYSISKVTNENTGFYKLYSTAQNDEQLAGMTRLIVQDKDNSAACDNGGVLREDGTCMCYPPFTGEYCDELCEDKMSYGPKCQWTCPNKDCEEVFVCHQDPAGCKCASGWMGPTCKDTCASGDFGPNCNQVQSCKCRNSTDVCDRRTGQCPGGLCADGFCGLTCTKQVPMVDFTVKNSTTANNELLIEWNVPQADAWETRYSAKLECNYTCINNCGSEYMGSFTATPSNGTYTLSPLKPYSDCSIECKLSALCGDQRTDGGSNEKSAPTNDEAPSVMDKNVAVFPTAEGILLTWRTPKGEQDKLLRYLISSLEVTSDSVNILTSISDNPERHYLVSKDSTSRVVPAEIGKTYQMSIKALTATGWSLPVEIPPTKYEFPPLTTVNPPATTVPPPPVNNCDNSKERTFLIVVIVFLAIILLLLVLAAVFFFLAKRGQQSVQDEYDLNEARAQRPQQSYQPASGRM